MRFLYDPLYMSLRDGVDEYRLGVVINILPRYSSHYLNNKQRFYKYEKTCISSLSMLYFLIIRLIRHLSFADFTTPFAPRTLRPQSG